MGEQLGRCARSVRRYLVEAESLGYVKAFRSKPERDPRTGKWCRQKSNAHYFCVPGRASDDQEAPRRRQRAPYCVVRPGRQRHAHRADNHGPSSPSGVRQPGAAPPTSVFEQAPDPKTRRPGEFTDLVLTSIAQAKAALFAARAGSATRLTPP